LLVSYELLFARVHGQIGTAAFLMALVPCFVAGLSLGARAAFVTVLATIWLDRSHALSLGLPAGAPLVASILGKLLIGVGAGVLTDHQRRLRELNTRLTRETAERKRAEAQLWESERLQRELVENLGEGVGLFDAGGRLLFANPTFFRILHVDAGDLVGRTFSAWPRAQDFTAYPHSYEVVLPERAGRSERLLVVTETRLSGGSQRAGDTVCVVRDLTERVTAEQRQRKLELDLERNQALQGLAVLAGGVAHDFNNLLGGVLGNAELAKLKLPANASPELAQCLTEIKAFAQEAAALSRQMLAYAGRRSLAVTELDVNRELEVALRLVRTTIAARAELNLQLAAELPLVHADATQFKQVVTNLLLNAVEALDQARGSVTLTTRVTHLATADLPRLKAPPGVTSGDYIEVAVEDTGSGIAPELCERIFQPYFSTKAQGRGMGLAAAWGIARSHRGWLSVESKLRVGSRLSLWLPVGLRNADGVTAPAPQSGVQALRRDCVLVIDDEPAVRLVTGKLLTELGRSVVTAECGQRGLELFAERQREIGLVLLDLTMPDLSGAEVLTRLRAIQPSVSVVLTSGFQPADALTLTSEPNVVGFLQKPHTLADLEALFGSAASAPERSRLAH
jgi:signal transduction histidine kinase/CheY-like chemotaxis protein